MNYRIMVGIFLIVSAIGSSGAVNAGDWVDHRVAGHLHIFADFPLSTYPQLVAQLGRLERDLADTLKLSSTGQPVQLFLFYDKAAYRGYLQQYFPGAPQRRALFIKGRGPGMVFAYQNPQFEIDVRHECTHALLHTMLPMVPLWLDEGLAEYFEVPPDKRTEGNPHQGRTRWAAWLYQTRKLEELEALRDISQMGNSEYRSAWAWVHFLLNGPAEARAELIGTLRDIQQERDPELLSRRLRRALPKLDSDFRKHFR